MDYQEENNSQLINETYKIWKKNCPFLYQMLSVYQLPSCSQTVDWFSDSYIENDWEINTLLIGSNSLTKNYIATLTIALPTDESVTDYTSYRETPQEGNTATMGQQILRINTFLPQNAEIMKARVNRVKDNIIACKTGGMNPELLIYNLHDDLQEIENNKLTLSGHDAEGFGLDWHPKQYHRILSGSQDKKVLLWDLNQNKGPNSYEPIFTGTHNEGVLDVKWSTHNQIFGSVGQDRLINLWDLRQNISKPAISKQAHSGQILCLDFNPFSEQLLLTGSQDTDIMLWDTRNMSKRVHTFTGHNDSVNTIRWCPQHPLRFASGSSDRRVVVWDMSQIKPGSKSPDQIMFIHGGHRTKVTDLCFHKSKYSIASCEEASLLQVWQMNKTVYSEDQK